MKTRYFSHYIYIEPDILLKNYIIEIDDKHHIVDIFPFEKEIERTEFYSGILVFVNEEVPLYEISLDKIKNLELRQDDVTLNTENKYRMLHFDDFMK